MIISVIHLDTLQIVAEAQPNLETRDSPGLHSIPRGRRLGRVIERCDRSSVGSRFFHGVTSQLLQLPVPKNMALRSM